jgi:uracil-DNA glycosylase family 4
VIDSEELTSCMKCWRKRDTPAEHPRVTRGYGNPDAPILILTHQPRQLALRDNYPLVGKQLSFLRERLIEVGISLHQDTYMVNIVCCVADSLKLPMVRECGTYHRPLMTEKKTQLVIALGHNVAKYIFGRGKSVPAIDSLAGKPLRQFDLKDKTIFVLRHPEVILAAAMEDEGLWEEQMRKNHKEYKNLQVYIKSDERLTQWLSRSK